jgi:hypothetical protein
MRGLMLLLAGCGLALAAHAADPPATPASAPARPPFSWRQAIPVVALVGADVSTGASAQAGPSQLVLRVTELARLPQWIPGAAECVFDTEAWANLSSERVLLRTRMLRCYDALGKEVHVKPVNGFAVDKDGRTGLKSPLAWGPTAKDLLLMGAGAQAKSSSGLSRFMSSALGRASFGLTDSLTGDDDSNKGPSADAVHELRSMDTLLPTLGVEPGREFLIVLQGPVAGAGVPPAAAPAR